MEWESGVDQTSQTNVNVCTQPLIFGSAPGSVPIATISPAGTISGLVPLAGSAATFIPTTMPAMRSGTVPAAGASPTTNPTLVGTLTWPAGSAAIGTGVVPISLLGSTSTAIVPGTLSESTGSVIPLYGSGGSYALLGGSGTSLTLVTVGPTPGYGRVVLPYRLIVPLALLLPLAHAGGRGRMALRRWSRRRLGLCIYCSYDLRATPERCPECGRRPPEA